MKKVGKTTRLFRYILNQIPYNYTVEVTNKFKGLNLVDRMPEKLWTEVCNTVQKEKECKKAKWLSEEALQIPEKRREAKGKGEREIYSQVNAEIQRTAKKGKRVFLSEQCKEIEENNRMRKTRDLVKKIRDDQENMQRCMFMQRWAQWRTETAKT